MGPIDQIMVYSDFSLIRASLMRADCAQSAIPNIKIMQISLENES